MDNAFQDYNSFICYRKKQGKKYLAPSEDVAGLLHWWLNHDALFSEASLALFEERYHGDLSYDEPGIKLFMPQMKFVFLVICPLFFSELLEDCEGITEANAHEFDRKFCQKGTVSYLEIKHALSRPSADCKIYPIYVMKEDHKPYLSKDNFAKLSLLFGPRIHEVLTEHNAPTFNYDEIENDTKAFAWNEATDDAVQELVEGLEKHDAVQKLKSQVLSLIARSVETKPFITEEDIVDDLRKCALTILNSPRNSIEQNSGSFHANNPDIIYDPIRFKYEFSSNSCDNAFLAKCLIDRFKQYKDSLLLPSEIFRYWNVDLDPQSPSDGISVCSVCFGTLLTRHRLNNDQMYIQSSRQLNEKTFKRIINAGINLIIALRNPYTKTWPASWEYGTKDIEAPGTINQTTLCLSTLLGCKFLSKDSLPANCDVLSHLQNRYTFIWESANALINEQITINDFMGSDTLISSWPYRLDHSATAQSSTMATVFTFDTLLKLRKCTQELLPQFTDQPFHKTLQEDMSKLNLLIKQIFAYFEDRQLPDGSFRRLDDDDQSSVTHTAHIIRSLLIYINHHHDDNDLLAQAQAIVDNASQYIIQRLPGLRANPSTAIAAHEEYDDFYKDADYDIGIRSFGYYEHSVELIIIETLIELYRLNPDKYHTVFEDLKCLFSNFKNSRIVCRNNNLYVKGRHGIKYPIYCLYYYRMVLLDLLSLTKAIEAKKDAHETD